MARALAAVLPILVSSLDLTPINWEAATQSGTKDVFLKFFQTWCGHCQKIQPDWEKLMEEFSGHRDVLVAEVNCGGEGSAICEMADVKSYPTILYGNPHGKDVDKLAKYEQGRVHVAMRAFAVERWGEAKVCLVQKQDHCSDSEKALIAKLQSNSDVDLVGLITENRMKSEHIEDAFAKRTEELGDLMEVLQDKYQKVKGSKGSNEEIEKLQEEMDGMKAKFSKELAEKDKMLLKFGEEAGLRFMEELLRQKNPTMAAGILQQTAPQEKVQEPAADEEEEEGEVSFGLEFSKAISHAEVEKEAQAQQKPAVVFITQSWCGMCTSLKKSVSQSAALKNSLKGYVVAHAAGDDGKKWQFPGEKEGYIPRVYFLNAAGKMLDIKGPHGKQYLRFFSDATDVQDALKSLSNGGDDDFDPDFALDGEVRDEDFDPDLAVEGEL